jgi:hypothetical protein
MQQIVEALICWCVPCIESRHWSTQFFLTIFCWGESMLWSTYTHSYMHTCFKTFVHTCFKAFATHANNSHKEKLGHKVVPNTTMHMSQSSRGKMWVFKMCLPSRWIGLNGDHAFLGFYWQMKINGPLVIASMRLINELH